MKERASAPGGCWKLRSIRLHQARRPTMTEAYDGRQVVGMDLHRRRSVLVRMTEDGRKLETVRIKRTYVGGRVGLTAVGGWLRWEVARMAGISLICNLHVAESCRVGGCRVVPPGTRMGIRTRPPAGRLVAVAALCAFAQLAAACGGPAGP